ncbi:MAG TPA: cell division protein FtsL [Acidobacteriaceae bacterium]|nr:cell division protein FtsL [Acidobacteriaceae bacterium]
MATQVIAAQTGFEYDRGSASRFMDRVVDRNQTLMAAQQRARRGPTPEVLFAKRFDNSRLVKAADPARAKEMRTFACVMALLFSLFMIYGWQHLSGIEYGYHIESEKAQVQHLEEQNRQLRLSEAQLVDPGRIDQLSRQYGLGVPTPGQVVRPDASLDSNANGPVVAEAHPLLPSIH